MLALCLLILPTAGRAHFPALYGKEFVRAQPAPKLAPPPRPTVPMGKADADAYAEQLYEQESLSGPYGETLAELLSSLGRYHQERGYFREAL